jgi:phenylacetate-CoA ligase
MNPRLYKFIFYTKNRVSNPSLLRHIEESQLNQFLSKKETDLLIFTKLKKLILHSYTNAPFYKEKFDHAGFHPNQFKSLADIEKIPLLTKQEIRDNIKTIAAENLPKERFEEVNTGGTTGIPILFYRDNGKKDLMSALYYRTLGMYGCDIGSKTAWIWGLTEENEYLDFRKKSFYAQYVKNVTWFNGFDMNPQSMKDFAEFSFRFKPDLIISYVSSIYEYALFLKQFKIDFRPPKAIWLTAEPADEMQRQVIETVFQCPTFSQYGSSEILHIASECKAHDGLHIHADSRYVEVTDSAGNPVPMGETGYIVVTDLENYAMPIIRYKNDDMSSVKPGKCTCGNNFPMLNPIMGRVYNVFKLKSGKQIYGHMFSRKLFTYTHEIKQFQIHQTDYSSIKVNLVPNIISDKKQLIKELENYFRHYTGDEVEYNFNFVEAIERERSGKLLYTKSDIK